MSNLVAQLLESEKRRQLQEYSNLCAQLGDKYVRFHMVCSQVRELEKEIQSLEIEIDNELEKLKKIRGAL